MTTPSNTEKNCLNCPSYLDPVSAGRFFGKGTNAPMCAQFGTVLGSPKQNADERGAVGAHYASKCQRYGQQAPARPQGFNTHVTNAHPEALMEPLPSEQERAAVPSCLACKHFVPEPEVLDKLGFVSGLCAYTGRLLLGDRLVAEAQQCHARRPGTPHRDPLDKMLLMPIYQTQGPVNITPDSEFAPIEISSSIIEPLDYETDKPVSEKNIKAGIKAWRKISNPKNPKKFVWLPIYNPDHFSEAERELIPKSGDEEHPELYQDHGGFIFRVAACWSGLDETPALWGKAGTGKTELFRHLAWMMQVPFRRISITASSDVDDLIGKPQYSPELGTHFIYGRLVIGWKSPGVLALDEPNVGPPEVWQAIRPLTDNSKQMVVDQNEGERVPRHVDCYLGMAMNPAWDVVNVGAQQIGDADGSRLEHIFMEYPPDPIERHIIRERCKVDGFEIEDNELDLIMKIAADIRGLTDDNSIPITWGVRNQIKVARNLAFFDMVDAYRMAVLDYLEPEVASTVKSILLSYLS